MKIFFKNELWMCLFAIGLLYWLFNPGSIISLIMIVPLLFAITSNR